MTGTGECQGRDLHILWNGGPEPPIKDRVTHKLSVEPCARKAAEQTADVLFDTTPESGIRKMEYRATLAPRALMPVSFHG
jgi:hypothetical protein